MIDYRVFVFAYDFAHRKTEDILRGLQKNNVAVGAVVGAPKLKLKFQGQKVFKALPHEPARHTKELCEEWGYNYFALAHDETEKLKDIVGETKSNIAVISGARIIKADVIELFEHGVVNYHPGKIPETSGLDSFFRMIEKKSPPLVTAHFIDHKVDAGQLILEEPALIQEADDVPRVHRRLYEAQLSGHEKICKKLAEGETFQTTPLHRPEKNEALDDVQRAKILETFEEWKAKFC